MSNQSGIRTVDFDALVLELDLIVELEQFANNKAQKKCSKGNLTLEKGCEIVS